MKFDDLDKKMRVFETAADLCVLPSMFMVARLDGRSFTRLTKEVCQFEAPFDVRFRDLMVSTTESLMTCGFRVLYAYTESDEISLLFDPEEQLFGRKMRKYNSTLAGEASAQFSLKQGTGRGLLPLAQRGCRSQRFECMVLLDASQGRPERASGHKADARPVRESEERVAVPVRDQFQRSPELAEAGRRIVLGRVR